MYLLVTKYEDTVKNTVIRISMPIKKSGLQVSQNQQMYYYI
jgi:hypothetical protein